MFDNRLLEWLDITSHIELCVIFLDFCGITVLMGRAYRSTRIADYYFQAMRCQTI